MRAERPPTVALYGIGAVGRAFLQRLIECRPPFRLGAAADSRGALIGELDPAEVLARKARGEFGGTVLPPEAVLEESGAVVLVDATSCDFSTGEPAGSLLQQVLGLGRAVATANKAPLALSWVELRDASDDFRRLRYSAAVGAGLPAVAVARALSRMEPLDSLEGVLTGTTTFVLERMAAGASLAEAVAAAQAAGIAEPDPWVDLRGWDTAAKLVILANTAWPDADLTLDRVEVRGIEDMGPSGLVGRVRLLGLAGRDGEGLFARVEPTVLSSNHPLARLQGSEKGVVFRGPAVSRVVVTGGRSHPRAAAAALLGDVLDLLATAG